MKATLTLIAILALALLLGSGLYTVDMTEQVIITQFGMPVGEPVTEAGLHWKTPFIQTVNRFEKRVMEWDGPAAKMPTKDKVFIMVDTFGRWQIDDVTAYFKKVRDERSALSRLNDILGSETRNIIAKHDFIEAVRTTKDRTVSPEALAMSAIMSTHTKDAPVQGLPPINKGRVMLEEEIFKSAETKVREYGVKLLDVRFKRIDYDDSVSTSIHQRMITERQKIAEMHRSEGAGQAAEILGERERDLAGIESEAYRKVQEIEGAADAKATEIYAKAYNASPDAVQLFEFLKTMDAYKKLITTDTQMIFTTDSDLFRFLKSADPQSPAPALPSSLSDPLHKLPTLLEVK
ncbi:MAG: protease modulator HflC [Verrucomicrobiaceae bacterium]|nr:protease modulator HflC [Verrucomicrobiaceae bacterium]